MIEYLLKNAEFSKIFRFISPNFLRVVSPAVLMSVARDIKRNRKNETAWASLIQGYSIKTSFLPLSIQIGEATNAGTKQQSLDSLSLGSRVLTLFFHQILTQDVWILDFRSEAFQTAISGDLKWLPQPYFYKISTSFLSGVRGLYRGFYTSDDRLFNEALEHLGLFEARQSLLNHFGAGDQTKVHFQLKIFQNTFTEVFEACSKAGIKLQPEFFVLGLSLLALYENLETLSVSFNVRACFQDALLMSKKTA